MYRQCQNNIRLETEKTIHPCQSCHFVSSYWLTADVKVFYYFLKAVTFKHLSICLCSYFGWERVKSVKLEVFMGWSKKARKVNRRRLLQLHATVESVSRFLTRRRRRRRKRASRAKDDTCVSRWREKLTVHLSQLLHLLKRQISLSARKRVSHESGDLRRRKIKRVKVTADASAKHFVRKSEIACEKGKEEVKHCVTASKVYLVTSPSSRQPVVCDKKWNTIHKLAQLTDRWTSEQGQIVKFDSHLKSEIQTPHGEKTHFTWQKVTLSLLFPLPVHLFSPRTECKCTSDTPSK